ncbi:MULTISPECIES: hypothetical protein [unclassified Ruegeria]|nr:MULTISPECIES: hypothetical protein [unclassified Ruegeria]
MDSIPDCVAAGYVDMETGMLLGLKSDQPDHTNLLENLALAVANLFQGRGVRGFESLLRMIGTQEDDNPGFGEIAVFSDDRLHIFLRTREYPDHVVCYVCRSDEKAGLALTKSHLSLGPVAAAV